MEQRNTSWKCYVEDYIKDKAAKESLKYVTLSIIWELCNLQNVNQCKEIKNVTKEVSEDPRRWHLRGGNITHKTTEQ